MKIRLLEYDREFYDYKTGDVVDKVLFDEHKAEASYYNSIMEDPEYYKKAKNKYAKVVYMTPEEYYQKCANEIFRTGNAEALKSSRAHNVDNIQFLKDVILKQRKKFPIAVLDYTGPGQEGLHRMYVAGELSGWDFKQPVLVIDWYDKERQRQWEEKKRIYEIRDKIEKALNWSFHYEYLNIEDFKEQVAWDLERAFDEREIPYTLDINGDICVLTVKNIPYEFPVSNIKIVPESDDEDFSDIDIDIDDIDFSDDSWINDLLKR